MTTITTTNPFTFDFAETTETVGRRPARPARRPAYGLRRALASVVLALVLAVAATGVNAVVGFVGDTPAVGDGGASIFDTESYLVQPGDTMWSIAGELGLDRDVRSVVADLDELNGGTSLLAGEVIEVPVR